MDSHLSADFAERLSGLCDPQAIWNVTVSHLDTLGIDAVFYADIRPARQQILCNVERSWIDFYDAERYAEIDPFFRHSCATLATSRTGPDYLDMHPYLNARERNFIQIASETGVRAGIAVPFRVQSAEGVGGWHLLSTGGKTVIGEAFERHRAHLGLVALLAHIRLSELDTQEHSAPALSRRERECLQWLGAGLRTKEIAERLRIKPVTVDLHLATARRKLGTRTRAQTIARAVARGVIEL